MSNAFDSMFRRTPSIGEGADFFLKLKKFAYPDEAPADGMEQTQSGSPFQDQVIQLMLQMVQNEFKTMLAYKTYAQTVRGPGREGLAEEFEEHAENEIKHADFLLRRLSVLMGGPVPVPDIPPPPPLDNPEEIIHTMIQMEQEGIESWKALLGLLGDNPTKYEIEAILTRELEHVDELFQFLPPQGAGAEQETTAAPQQPAKEETQQGQPGTPQAGGGPQAGAPPGIKLSFAKTAARERFVRDSNGNIIKVPARYEGSLDEPGAWASALDEAFKYACKTAGVKLPDKIPGNVSRDSTKGSSEAKTPDLEGGADVFAQGGKQGSAKLAFTGAEGPPQQGKRPSKVDPNEFEPVSDPKGEEDHKAAAAPEHLRKAKERGEANAVARSTQMKGQRGELYGDLVGRLLGGAGGWKAGKVLAGKSGDSLAKVMGLGLAQAAGGRVGKQVGREVDAASAKKKLGALKDIIRGAAGAGMGVAGGAAHAFMGPGMNLAEGMMNKNPVHIGVGLGGLAVPSAAFAAGRASKKKEEKQASPLLMSKTALEDQMNMLASEQQAEQQEMANSARFYAEKAREHSEARSQLEQQLQEAQGKMSENEANIAQMQQAMSENSQAASQSTTQALLQAVQSNTQAIQQRQLAADAANANQTLRDQLRQLADGSPSSGDTQGPGDPQGATQGPSGGPTAGSGQQALQDGAGNAPPAGESNAYQPIQSPESGLAKGEPARIVGNTGDTRQPSTPSAYKDGGQGKMGAAKIPPAIKPYLKSMGFGAAGGAGIFGGETALQAAKGPKSLIEKEEKLKTEPKSFSNSMALAKTHAERAHREHISEHPVGSTVASMARGAVMGSALGPAAHAAGKKVIQNIKELRGKK
jgi:bacterioferritin